MSLIEDAKALVARTPYNGSTICGATVCGFCNEEIGMFWEEDGPRHEPTCPWLAMPRIVAALEAAEAQEARLAYLVSRLRALVDEYAP